MKLKLIFLCTMSCLVSCANFGTSLSQARKNHQEKMDKLQSYSDQRAVSITEQKTAYSDAITCLSDYFVKYQSDRYLANKQPDTDSAYQAKVDEIDTAIKSYQSQIFEKRKEYQGLILFVESVQKDVNLHKKKKLIEEAAKKSATAKILSGEIDVISKKISQLEAERILYLGKNKSPSPNGVSLGEIYNLLQGSKWMNIGVNNIYDKTGKIYKDDSTALSEMVAQALSYNKGIRYVDTPFNAPLSYARTSVGNINSMSIGEALSIEKFITGALVQYDEGTPLTSTQAIESLKLSIDPLDVSNRTTIINVGLTLRLINRDGIMYFTGYVNPRTKKLTDYEPASVYLQNTFFVKQIGASLFEIKSRRNYGFNTTVITSDPKHYAIRELIERGVYELLLKVLPNQRLEKNLTEATLNYRLNAKHQCDQKFLINGKMVSK